MTWYGIVDTAQDPRLHDAVRETPKHVCLFAGKLDPAVAAAAPWLVDLDAAPAFAQRWQAHGWSRNWGLVCRSGGSLEQLRRHFRKFLATAMPDGSTTLFRFYDPRVFRTYLPTADANELAAWFDGIDEYAVAAADGAGSHRLVAKGGTLLAQPPLPGS